MSCEKFRDVNFRPATLALIEDMRRIVDEYAEQDLTLTLRQLYYQLVQANIVENTEQSYRNVGGALSDARLAGLIDWDAIEDRMRRPDVPSEWDECRDVVRTALKAFRLPRRRGQLHYVELWVEKDALAGVLEPMARYYHVPLMVNRGYSSSSAMYAASKRFLEAGENDGLQLALGYIGDHDPSGEHMVKDVRDRLAMFGADVDVEKIALTTEQVRRFNPPPNPVKINDSRAADYIRKHGTSSWEVDALPPRELQSIARRYLERHTHMELMREVVLDEDEQRGEIAKLCGIGHSPQISYYEDKPPAKPTRKHSRKHQRKNPET